MNLFEISSSSDSDDDFDLTPSGKEKVISIDELSDRRNDEKEKEKLFKDLEKSEEVKNEKIPELIECPRAIDGTIFDEKNVKFPQKIFDFIKLDEGSQTINLSTLDPVPSWVNTAASYFPEKIPINSELIYRILYQLFTSHDEKFGDTIVNLMEHFPKHFLEFCKIYQLTKLIINSKEELAIYALILLDPKFYIDYDSNLLEMTNLIIGGILSTKISSHPLFYHLPILLVRALSDPEVPADDESISADEIFEVVENMPIESVSSLISFLPMEKSCANFTLDLSLKLLFKFMDVKPKNQTKKGQIGEVIQHISCIKSFVKDSSQKKLKIASAIIALFERLIVTATAFFDLDKKKINRLITDMKMSINGKDPSDLTNLKEQLHMTRVHLENISKEAFGNIPIETNPWK